MYNRAGNWLVGTATAGIVVSLFVLGMLSGCGDDTADQTRAAQMRAIVKENTDLRAELSLRRLPESDQVAAFQQERIEHSKQMADLARQLEEARVSHVDASLAPLQAALNDIRAKLADLQVQTARDIQDIRGRFKPGDSCHCGQ